MHSSATEIKGCRARSAVVTADALTVELEDGRSVSVPIAWYPRLLHGTAEERSCLEISGAGIHWPDLDEDIHVEALLKGYLSGESQASLNAWLNARGVSQVCKPKIFKTKGDEGD